jgi:hypothetical protein
LQDAINFAITSGSAKSVKLVLFTEDDLAMGKSTYEVMLDPTTNKTGAIVCYCVWENSIFCMFFR